MSMSKFTSEVLSGMYKPTPKMRQTMRIYSLVQKHTQFRQFRLTKDGVFVYLHNGYIRFYFGRSEFAPGEYTPMHMRAETFTKHGTAMNDYPIGEHLWKARRGWRFLPTDRAIGEFVKQVAREGV